MTTAVNPLFYRLNPLSFSVRVGNVLLQQCGLIYVGELVQCDDMKLLRTKNFGRKALREVVDFLATMNLRLYMTIDDWPAQLAAAPSETPLTPPRDFGGYHIAPPTPKTSILADFASAQRSVAAQAQRLADRIKAIDSEIATLQAEKVAVTDALAEYQRKSKS